MFLGVSTLLQIWVLGVGDPDTTRTAASPGVWRSVPELRKREETQCIVPSTLYLLLFYASSSATLRMYTPDPT